MRSLFCTTLLLAVTSALAAHAQLNLHILDASTNQPVADTTITVDGHVLTPNSDKTYTLPADTQSIMARAPGYRAITVPLADIRSHNNTLALHPFTVHALYLSEFGISSSILRDSALDIIRKGGANALVVNIKSDHGQLVYPSAIPLAKQIGARNLTTIHSLSDLVNNAHAQGIYMIARIVTFKDTPLATSRPDLAIHLANGSLFKDREGLSWTDPFKPEVRAYNIAIAVEAAKAGFDEVQFDYVRFPDSTTKLVVSGPTDEPNRIKAITSFLAEAHAALAPYNVFESADIFGYTFWNTNDTGIGQQLDHLVNTIDYLCPMLYPSGFHYGIPGHPKPLASTGDIYSTIKLTLDNGLRRTNANPKKFRPWLQAFRDYAFGGLVFGPEQVSAQIRAADADHTDGWSLWNPRNRYTNIGLTHIISAGFALPLDTSKPRSRIQRREETLPMNPILKRLSGVACTAALLSFTALAFAQPPQDQDHGGQHFRDQDRSHLQQHYGTQAHQWANKANRPHFAVGAAIPRNYHLQPVPNSYWGGDVPPPGCDYAYYDGYVVCYNPTTRVINDLVDLATGQ